LHAVEVQSTSTYYNRTNQHHMHACNREEVAASEVMYQQTDLHINQPDPLTVER